MKSSKDKDSNNLSELLESEPSEYSQQLRIGFRNLKFIPSLEKEFQFFFDEKRLSRLQVAVPIGALITLTFVLSDFLRFDETLLKTIFISRFTEFVALLALWFCVHRQFTQYLEAMSCVALLIYGATAVYILGQINLSPYHAPIYSILAILSFCYFMLGISLRLVAGTALLITALFPIGFYLMGIPFEDYSRDLFFMLIFHTLGIPGAWYIEYSARENFLNRQLLSKLAMYDSLTSLPNRRSFFTDIARLCRQADRDGTSLAVAMLDVDRFKNYNDHFGHMAGDRCLQKIASILTQSVKRPFDNVGRYGGEEFALVWYNCDENQARQLADTLRKDIQAMALKQAPEIEPPVITVSIGVCVRPPTSHYDEDRAISIADKALYEAKTNGRNQIAVHSPQ